MLTFFLGFAKRIVKFDNGIINKNIEKNHFLYGTLEFN